jgi:hypothetical protein
MNIGYAEVSTYDDRVKATLWQLLEDLQDENKRGGSGG